MNILDTTRPMPEIISNQASQHTRSILNIYNGNCPILRKSVSAKVRKRCFTDDILHIIKFKQYLFDGYKKNYIPCYIYNHFKNMVCKITEKARTCYVRGEVLNYNG